MKNKGILYLIPTALGEEGFHVLPDYILDKIKDVQAFIVEHPKSARASLRRLGFTTHFDDVEMFVLNKRTPSNEFLSFLNPCENGADVGILSEAGNPCIADPGASIVALAHQKDIIVYPLVGPSSILLALIGSGFNGQQFTFHGYLPIKTRVEAVRRLEVEAKKTGYTQIFIETPYRNISMLKDLTQHCHPQTKLSVAVDVTLSTQQLQTLPIHQWKNKSLDYLHKRPAVFLIGR